MADIYRKHNTPFNPMFPLVSFVNINHSCPHTNTIHLISLFLSSLSKWGGKRKYIGGRGQPSTIKTLQHLDSKKCTMEGVGWLLEAGDKV